MMMVDSDRVSSVLNQLADAIRRADPLDIEIQMEALKTYLGDEAAEAMEADVLAYEYDAALEKLAEIAGDCGVKL